MDVPKDIVDKFKRTNPEHQSGILNPNFTKLGTVGADLDKECERQRNLMKLEGATIVRAEAYKDDPTASLRSRMLALMEHKPDHQFTCAEFAKLLNVVINSNMYVSLTAMQKTGEVLKVSTGHYMLATRIDERPDEDPPQTNAAAAMSAILPVIVDTDRKKVVQGALQELVITSPWPEINDEPEPPMSHTPIIHPSVNDVLETKPEPGSTTDNYREILKCLNTVIQRVDQLHKDAVEGEEARAQLRQLKSLLGGIK